MTASEGLDILRTPAYKAALRQLMAAGTWVAREDLAGCSHSSVALDDALADLVMLGQAEYLQGAGYRLTQPAVVRRAAKVLLERPDLPRFYQVLQVSGGVHVGAAHRTGPGDDEIAMAGFIVPSPEGLDDLGCVDHAVAVAFALGGDQRA